MSYHTRLQKNISRIILLTLGKMKLCWCVQRKIHLSHESFTHRGSDLSVKGQGEDFSDTSESNISRIFFYNHSQNI